MRHFILLLISSFSLTILSGQVANDECSGASLLSNVGDFCSGVGEYSFSGATESAQATPSCWGGTGNDVWFVFQGERPGVSIRFVGATDIFTGGNFAANQVSIAVYSGNCGNLTEIACNARVGGSNVVTTNAEVNVGENYFIRVSSRGVSSGETFQLCITSFDLVPDPISDCEPGVLLCDKTPFIVPFLETAGNVLNEIVSDGLPCGAGTGGNCEYDEFQSAWYKWICDDPGSLTFTLTPLNPVDDLDFWVYELPNGVDDCSGKTPLLCMASGAIQNAPSADWIRCHGPTGLRSGEADDHENCGCDGGDNNFIRPLQMEAGKAYALIVMNFSNSDDGFAVTFGGTGTFVGPDIDFIIDPELDNQCDIDEVTFINNSTSGIGDITSFEWNFGRGASMNTADTEGPHDIRYESFGTKNIVLRIQTDAGCSKTEIRSIFIEPCCDPANNLQINVDNQIDPACPGLNTGFFNISGTGGSPEYEFSSNGTDFNPITSFNLLEPGVYSTWIQDIKGCRDSVEVTINPAPPFEVDAGADQNTQLGCETNLSATITGNPPFTFQWDTIQGMSCFDCLEPTVLPPGTTNYVIRAQSNAGCSSVDSVLVNVEIVRPFFIPSAFSPNNDGINDFFTGFGGKQVVEIQRLAVFDRWGNMLFLNENFPPGVESEGWDGAFNTDGMDTGVYTFFCEVLYVDNVVILYEGDVSLFR